MQGQIQGSSKGSMEANDRPLTSLDKLLKMLLKRIIPQQDFITRQSLSLLCTGNYVILQ